MKNNTFSTASAGIQTLRNRKAGPNDPALDFVAWQDTATIPLRNYLEVTENLIL